MRMREIIPNALWLGNALDAEDLTRLLDMGIEAIVCLAAEELPPRITRDLIYGRYPLVDGAGNSPQLLRAAIECVVSVIDNKLPTLVYCGAGMSRSPAVVSAALAIAREASPDQVLADLVRNHPHDVSPILWQEIRNAIGFDDATRG